MTDDRTRCSWAISSPLILAYHDQEWGVPEHDDRKLFELLILGGAQAGLSWETILKKRGNYRKAFDNFDFKTIAEYGDTDIERLLVDPGIIRNRLKIAATVENARRILEVRDEVGSLDEYVWNFVGGKPIRNRFRSLSHIPARTTESETMSKDMRKRGFRFVGPTICYSFMQAVGMVNDHLVDCFRYDRV